MQHPFQRLTVAKNAAGGQSYLLAAAGPTLYCYHATSGARLSKWPETEPDVAEKDTADAGSERPQKKRRTEATSEEVHNEPESSEKTRNGHGKGPPKSPGKPNIINLIISRDGRYVIVVTGGDKTIHVITWSADGILQGSSAR